METYLTIFIAVTALAVVIQAGILLALYLTVARVDRETREVREQIRTQSGPILRNVEELSATARDRSRVILEDLSAISYDARRQMEKVDRLTDELGDRLRLQLIRSDELITQALNNLEDAGATVKHKVTEPLREAAAVVQGVKAALEFLGMRRAKGRRRERVDEELFI